MTEVHKAKHNDDYFDVMKTSQVLQIHPESVRRLYRQGQLAGFKSGNKILFPREIVVDYAKHYPRAQKQYI